MSQPSHTLNAEPVQYTLMTRVFGFKDSPLMKRKVEISARDLTAAVEKVFLNAAAASAAIERSCVVEKAASFVTFSANPGQMKRWELSADIRVITPDLPGQPGAVEANFQSLTRDFGACVAIPLFYGQDFLDRCPRILDDLWKFDNDLFPLMMIGVPPWVPLKVVKEGVAARSRLHAELAALYRRIDQHKRGEPVDFGADMSDISIVAMERTRVYERDGWSFPERGACELGAFWGQNANTQPMLFWFLTFVYSTPGLLEEIRKEMAPHIKWSHASSSPEIVSIDMAALYSDCQLMKACIFESYRLANEATSIRYVVRPITIDDGGYKHTLKPGTFVSAAHALTQRDPHVYADPDKFVPDRFLETDSASGKPVARYGRLRPWGAGAAMCKGRTFAERELMALGAAIMSSWDIEPAGGAPWKLPAMVPGTGVKKPVKDIRVLIRRRVL